MGQPPRSHKSTSRSPRRSTPISTLTEPQAEEDTQIESRCSVSTLDERFDSLCLMWTCLALKSFLLFLILRRHWCLWLNLQVHKRAHVMMILSQKKSSRSSREASWPVVVRHAGICWCWKDFPQVSQASLKAMKALKVSPCSDRTFFNAKISWQWMHVTCRSYAQCFEMERVVQR